ncbi:MAG: alpha/beta hydrolase [Firmicutes bacterium]|nr:alpha/beta hydrolase [Bacillota bacterium]
MKKLKWIIPAASIILLAAVFLCYTGSYYHADAKAEQALVSDPAVTVTETDYGWFFDGPAEDTGLVFYPGAKVEETAYAPLLHLLAAEKMDVCLVKMPLHLAVFGKDKAGEVMDQYDYSRWYAGGHSLGGAMAAAFAAEHGSDLEGVLLLAAYPTDPLDPGMTEVLIYGSEDEVLNMQRLEESRQYAPEHVTEHVIRGGNHAQFGSYGEQKEDGKASLCMEEQIEETVRVIDGAVQ